MKADLALILSALPPPPMKQRVNDPPSASGETEAQSSQMTTMATACQGLSLIAQ